MNLRVAMLTLLALAVAGGCVNRGAQTQADRQQKNLSDPVKVVSVQPVKIQTIAETLEVSGALTTSEDTSISAKIPGRLVAVYVKDGERVRAGQPIAQQETTDLVSRLRQAQATMQASQSQLQQAINEARIAPTRSSSAVAASRARLAQANANLQKVRAGARTEERRQVAAAVEAARSTMEVAKRDLDRARRLRNEGAISAQELERAQNAYDLALSQYQQALETQRLQQAGARSEDIETARQEVAAAEQQLRSDLASQRLDVQYSERVAGARSSVQSAAESVTLARQALADATIRSPFAGTISGKPEQAGTFLPAGGTVARLIGSTGTYFEAEIAETQLQNVRPGKPIQVFIDALGSRFFSGTIAAVSPQASDVGRLFKARVQLPGGISGAQPGMFARGVVDVRVARNAMVIPEAAVLRRGGQALVFLARSGKAVETPVQLGVRSGGLVQVMNLQEGDSVVVAGQSDLITGAKIRVTSPAVAEAG